ncbi:hypothetical protein [Microcoleus sp. CAWBG556]|uniref:hypothetical protein n=1 Tax=Microcoleus sp. CAWBG556 TaxID=2841650 RepID=UPI0025F53850|nr:hypothetical protein [Microcoleus sp. CAWBG556]
MRVRSQARISAASGSNVLIVTFIFGLESLRICHRIRSRVLKSRRDLRLQGNQFPLFLKISCRCNCSTRVSVQMLGLNPLDGGVLEFLLVFLGDGSGSGFGS